MTKKFFFILAVTWLLASACNREKTAYVLIETEFGNMKAMLYNSTPKHRDNFLKLAGEGYYNDLLFHRVIRGFMIQGGDPDSRNAAPGAMLGMGGPGYTIDAEIGAPHLKGVLAAARDMNPAKASSGSQFYIVQGQPVDDGTLTGLEQQKGFTYNPTQRQIYKEIGGAPFLDGDYTVFGEVVEGIEVIDKIAAVPTATADRPIADVKMKISVISNPF